MWNESRRVHVLRRLTPDVRRDLALALSRLDTVVEGPP